MLPILAKPALKVLARSRTALRRSAISSALSLLESSLIEPRIALCSLPQASLWASQSSLWNLMASFRSLNALPRLSLKLSAASLLARVLGGAVEGVGGVLAGLVAVADSP